MKIVKIWLLALSVTSCATQESRVGQQHHDMVAELADKITQEETKWEQRNGYRIMSHFRGGKPVGRVAIDSNGGVSVISNYGITRNISFTKDQLTSGGFTYLESFGGDFGYIGIKKKTGAKDVFQILKTVESGGTTNYTNGFLNDVSELVRDIEKREISEKLSPIDKELDQIEHSIGMLDADGSAISLLKNKQKEIAGNKCHCAFNPCLDKRGSCKFDNELGAHNGNAARAKYAACYERLDELERKVKERRRVLKKVCWSMKNAGLFLSDGETLEDALRNTVYDNKDINSELKETLKQAQRDLDEADRLQVLASSKIEERMVRKLQVEEEQVAKREATKLLAKQRRKQQVREIELNATKRAEEWLSCMSNAGFDVRNADKWKAFPTDCI